MRCLVRFDEMAAAVLLPAGLVALHAERLLFAVADGGDAVGGNAEGDEVLLGGVGATIAESEVVFGGAALVAMTLDGYFDLRVVLQEVRSLGKSVTSVGANVGLVEVEISVAHFLEEAVVEIDLRRWGEEAEAPLR